MKKTFLAVGMGVASCMWAAHTDAPPGRYDYTAKVAAAGQAGAAATTKSSRIPIVPMEALTVDSVRVETKIPTAMKSDYGIAAVSNSITLTPGTITMEVAEKDDQNYLYVHWIDVAETDPEKAGEAIKGTLEKGLRRVWE